MQARNKRVRKVVGGLAAAVLGMALAPLVAAPASAEENCVDYAIEAERANNIPSGLLVAISLVESGVDGEPQPFALSVGGRSVYARNAGDAARHLKDRRGQVRGNTYVGCMQISLGVHSGHFQPVERIVQPKDNVNFAARLLVRLHGEEGSWKSAVARYNGASMRQAQAYVCKVWQHLNELGSNSAKLLASARCDDSDPVSVSPATRRSFRDANQVAQLN